MRAIVLESFGALDSLVYKEIPDPEPKAGHVVIEIKAFGINHAEMHRAECPLPGQANPPNKDRHGSNSAIQRSSANERSWRTGVIQAA